MHQFTFRTEEVSSDCPDDRMPHPTPILSVLGNRGGASETYTEPFHLDNRDEASFSFSPPNGSRITSNLWFHTERVDYFS